jgi:hypothetical protein
MGYSPSMDIFCHHVVEDVFIIVSTFCTYILSPYLQLVVSPPTTVSFVRKSQYILLDEGMEGSDV